ncbi:hypothetical protein HBN99_03540 [Pseudomonas oryzihabitans]|uniref:DUF7222 domain-containing protein n=1 Tax=Pseudomonas oryzihabitans TaxID=47885 RepID=UPI001472BE46|nr:hypothetical protein [Pseudomonas oryzihabitans]NMZ63394.1 hypothetical protein [Pseudomonas oryzihabitans]
MSRRTLKAFIEATAVPATVVRAVVRQVGGWESFKESACDIASHGADAGWGGFTYYKDTVAFTRRHKADITQMAREMSREFGSSSVYAFIAGFNCLRGFHEDDVDDGLNVRGSKHTMDIHNALAWFALEETARSFSDYSEE